MKITFTILITLIFTILPSKEKVTVNNLQNSSAELSVEKNRNFKSIDEDGANFILKLKNTSGSRKSFIIRATLDSSPCSNEYNSNLSSKENSNLYMLLEVDNSQSMSNTESSIQTTLDAEQTKQFTLTATAPNGTEFNTWGCIKVEAISNKTISDEIILSVFIPDPSEE
ncbi:hypothetical protein [uncultured Algibacter sp.]|uniref:hypothetical protein n=1 Tax=uncultured Algibacter sp. TaxID=298659 RepID=UPI0026244568|nr:hypothetical protein [uncultured Algibacter sp.]